MLKTDTSLLSRYIGIAFGDHAPRSHRPLFVAIAATVALLSVGALSGCQAENAADSSTATVTAPAFDGPWADLLKEQYEHPTSNDFVRQVLADGVVTDAEMAETDERFRVCAEEAGITEQQSWITGEGSYEAAVEGLSNDEMHESMTRCGVDSGNDAIVMVYSSMHSNPDAQDETELIVECLTDHKLAEPGLTAAAYREAEGRFDTLAVPSVRGSEEASTSWSSCEKNPLGVAEPNHGVR